MHRLSVLVFLGLLASCPECGECFSDDDCRSSEACVEGVCLECERDSDCDNDEFCDDGECRRELGGPGDPCENSDECIPETVCFNEFCVGNGFLRVSLAFGVDSDYDLHVVTPTGAEISFINKVADGGALDVDQCITTCGDGVHVENIVFADTAPAGTYRVFVVNYDGRAGGAFNVEVAGAATQAFTGALTPVASETSAEFTFSL